MNPDKRQRIMQAAERVFRMRRFHEVTLDDIALEADVGKGTLYLYFSNKEDLIFQSAVAGFDEMCQHLRQHVADEGAFRETLLRTCESISDFFRVRRPLFRIIISEGTRDMEGGGGGLQQRWHERRKSMTDAVAAIIEKGMESGEIRGDVPADILAEYLLGMLRTRSWELEDRAEAGRRLELVVDIFINGAVGPAPRQT